MPEKPMPDKPEQVACQVCMKKLPVSRDHSDEGSSRRLHFCGEECFEKWQQMKPPQPDIDL